MTIPALDPSVVTLLLIVMFFWLLVLSYVLYRHVVSPHESSPRARADLPTGQAPDLSTMQQELATLQQVSERYVQKLGIVRYNPYNDTGGNQSFVIALLNARGDGIVLSSLHNRTGTRVYSKPVRAGEEAEFPLSDEEKQAIQHAMEDSS